MGKRVAYNELLRIPNAVGLFNLKFLEAGERLVIRIVGLFPRPCPGVVSVHMGNVVLDIDGLDRDTVYIIGPGQAVSVYCSIPLPGRSLHVTGYIEEDADVGRIDYRLHPEEHPDHPSNQNSGGWGSAGSGGSGGASNGSSDLGDRPTGGGGWVGDGSSGDGLPPPGGGSTGNDGDDDMAILAINRRSTNSNWTVSIPVPAGHSAAVSLTYALQPGNESQHNSLVLALRKDGTDASSIAFSGNNASAAAEFESAGTLTVQLRRSGGVLSFSSLTGFIAYSKSIKE